MRVKELRVALNEILTDVFPNVKIWQGDVKEPVTRPAFKLDLFPSSIQPLCGGERERTVDVTLSYYSENARDECEEIGEGLADELVYGVYVGGITAYLVESIEFNMAAADILVVQFSVSWTETLDESTSGNSSYGDGMMENLFLDGEELVHGSDDAED